MSGRVTSGEYDGSTTGFASIIELKHSETFFSYASSFSSSYFVEFVMEWADTWFRLVKEHASIGYEVRDLLQQMAAERKMVELHWR